MLARSGVQTRWESLPVTASVEYQRNLRAVADTRDDHVATCRHGDGVHILGAPAQAVDICPATDGVVSLTVSDDGAGFDPSRLGTAGGLGLIMMRERATQLNGKFEFESAPGRGTTIRVVIPFR